MEKKARRFAMLRESSMVASGVVRMEMQEKGWSYVGP
jgi:hypothetical protein